MADGLYKNKYRIKSARREGYDYAQNGLYFVTICTAGRETFFGDVKNGKMILHDAGKIAAHEWQKTANIRPYVRLDAWIIMPNHVHVILVIDHAAKNPPVAAPAVETPCQGVSTWGVSTWGVSTRGVSTRGVSTWGVSTWGVSTWGVSTWGAAPSPTTRGGRKREWKSGALGAIVNQCKRQCTVNIRATADPDFAWQTRFYDHIIRNERSLHRIRQYIMDNPARWETDRNNPALPADRPENLWM